MLLLVWELFYYSRKRSAMQGYAEDFPAGSYGCKEKADGMAFPMCLPVFRIYHGILVAQTSS